MLSLADFVYGFLCLLRLYSWFALDKPWGILLRRQRWSFRFFLNLGRLLLFYLCGFFLGFKATLSELTSQDVTLLEFFDRICRRLAHKLVGYLLIRQVADLALPVL